MFRSSVAGFLMLLVALGAALGQCEKTLEEVHSANICGLTIGMTPQQVLEAMKRPPDVGQVQGEDIVSGWQVLGGDLLSVRFRHKQYVSMLTLDFHPVMRNTDLGLPSALEESHASISSRPIDNSRTVARANRDLSTTHNSQVQLSYHRDETQNGERIVWYREEKDPAGYKLEIGFYSASRLKEGERIYQNDVASKYITVNKSELPNLDRAMSLQAAPSPKGNSVQ
jgi:hypothetical protein